MLKIIAVILYLYNGSLKLDQIPATSQELCMEKGLARIEELTNDPRTEDVLWAACVPIEVTEAKK